MCVRFTVSRCRNIAMMIASPTAASAAATVITKNTNTWPATPYACANATNARFTALSISSTHMKMMMALRRVRTPTTPMVNSTAEKKMASASTLPPSSQDHRADDRGQQQDAGELERQQVFGKKRPGDRRDHAFPLHLSRDRARLQRQGFGHPGPRQRSDLREHREADQTCRDLPPLAPGVGQLGRMAEVEQHDHEQEHHHDGARVYQHLDGADELRVEHDVERGEAEHRVHQPEGRGHGTLASDEEQRRHHGDDAEQVEMERVEKREVTARHHSPFGSAGSHISQTGCVCAMSRSRSYTNPSRLYSEFS